MNQRESCPNQVFSCFDIFFRINGINSSNFKYVKTKFYNKVCSSVTTSSASLIGPTKLSVRNQKHVYKKVSTPISCEEIPRFQQKGLIVVWPQRKYFHYSDKITLLSWILAQVMYMFYMTSILPSASVLTLKKPPWNYKWKIGKPLRRDYIIEPDWDSHYRTNNNV